MVQGVDVKAAADYGGPLVKPTAIVIHYTGGATTGADLDTLTRRDSNYVSSHFVISREGKITQCVPVNTVAWHAGESSWNGVRWCNKFSIGIELSNWGPLVIKGNKAWAWPGNFGRVAISLDRVFRGKHKNPQCAYEAWEKFYDPQFAALCDLGRVLVAHLGSIRDIVGHDDVAPGRKIDPGPAFPMDYFRSIVLGR